MHDSINDKGTPLMNGKTLQENEQAGIGLGIPWYIKGIQDVLDQSASKQIEHFLTKFDGLANHKWILSSDYTIHDDHKDADVLAFSLIPRVNSADVFKSMVQKLAPQDFKNSPTVNLEFGKFLRDYPFLHFVIIMPKGFAYMNANIGAHATKSVVRGYCEMLAQWEKTTSEAAERFSEIRRDLEGTLKNLERSQGAWSSDGGKHIKKIQDIMLVASISSAILGKIMDFIPNSQVCWMPDRDGTMAWPKSHLQNGKMFLEMVRNYLWISLSNRNKSSIFANLALAVPELSGSVWYDEYIRIPDYIAGVISRIDMQTGDSIERLRGLLENVIAGNENLIAVRIDETSACRIIYSKREK